MDRAIVYNGEELIETDILNGDKFAMIGLAKLAELVLGTTPLADGFACTPGAGLTVAIAAGQFYQQVAADATGFSSLGTDAHLVLKQGLMLDPASLACPAPGTAGQSINYLIEVAYQDLDTGSTVLPFYNASNPAIPYNGPANAGTPSMTIRAGRCAFLAKAGTAATTGTQTTPAADAGYTGLYVVTVANGAVSIVGGNIVVATGAPFMPLRLPNAAPIASPIFTGSPRAPTQLAGDNSTLLATDAFVQFLMSGLVTVNVAGGANVTLSQAQYGAGILVLTGLLTANINLTTPNSGRWIVANRTTGAFTITATTAGGTGIVVPQSASTSIFADGVNVAGSSDVTLADTSLRKTSTGLQANSPVITTAVSIGITAANHGGAIVATAAVTITAPLTTGLWNGYYAQIDAKGGLVTFTPNAADAVNGGSAGASYSVLQGQSAKFVTDGAGNWWPFFQGSSGSGAATLAYSARTANTILGSTDTATLVDITSGTFTQTLAAASTLGAVWWCYLRNSGTGNITIDPNGAETIDGAASRLLVPGETILVQCSGTALRTMPITGGKFNDTASGTWTKSANYTGYLVRVTGAGSGGGGGGGGGAGDGRSSNGNGGGGGSGGAGGQSGQTAWKYIPANMLPATVNYIVGAGGTAGSAGVGTSPGAASGLSVTQNSTNGGLGGAGGGSSFGTSTDAFFLQAVGGAAMVSGNGVRGTSAAGTLASNTTTVTATPTIGFSLVTAGPTVNGGFAPAGTDGTLGSGGGAGGDGSNGGASSLAYALGVGSAGAVKGTGSTVAPAPGNAGAAVVAPTARGAGGPGGAGGGGSAGAGVVNAATGAGGNGSAGATGTGGEIEIIGVV